MVIATSITRTYLDQSYPFFESVLKFAPDCKRICFTIGFNTTIEGWECIETAIPECEWKPSNRPDYASLQHGEFIKYIPDTEPDEMIMFLDSDMTMQRLWDLSLSSTRAVTVTACSWPQQTLWGVMDNFITHKLRKKIAKQYMIHEKSLEFCACLIIASFDRWESIYRGCRENYQFLENFKHHAAWQLLINVIVLNTSLSVKLAPEHLCNAAWYTGTRAKGEPLEVSVMGRKDDADIVTNEIVYFKHTKFNEQ